MNLVPTRPWARRAMLALFVLVLLAPIFGWAASTVGYAEPLENAAAATGAADEAITINSGLFPDYTVPGLGSSAETLVSASVGTALTLGITIGLGRYLEQ